MADSTKVPSRVASAAQEPLSVKPNNPLYSPYVRTPLPIGLWAYNYLYTERQKGFRHWLYKRLAKEPVTLATVQPDVRVRMAAEALRNNGYYGTQISYELHPRKHNPRKSKISYRVVLSRPLLVGTVSYPAPHDAFTRKLDSLSTTSVIHPGTPLNVDTLSAERDRIIKALREEGYYYLKRDHLEFQADSLRHPGKADLRLVVSPVAPEAALKAYRIGRVEIIVESDEPAAGWDTTSHGGYGIIYQKPLKVKPKVLASTIYIREGDIYRASAQNNTFTHLGNLSTFRYLNIGTTPIDSLKGGDRIDVVINTAMDLPMESEFEVDVSSKSNSYIGPGAIFGVSRKNLFGGGEMLSLKLNGEYEWQTGKGTQADEGTPLNSYEFGVNLALTIPRPWLPRFLTRRLHYPAHTTLQLGADLMNRPGYFQMVSMNTSLKYDFQSTPHSTHSFTPVKVTYNNLLASSESFDESMADNPAIALSFEDQFIPEIVYSYTFDKTLKRHPRNRFHYQVTVASAGNILSPLMGALGYDIPRKIFGNQFSQFVKLESDLRYYRRLGLSSFLVLRFYAGGGYAYGNATVMPYSEQFYSGGANSLRGFSSRSIGPGSYRPSDDDPNGYFNQTGDMRFEANAEFRFKIAGRLSGALFLDAGNVWLWKEDPSRPGGQLTLRSLPREIALASGTGLRYDISYLVLRADLGVALHAPYQTPGRNSYFNMPSLGKSLNFNLAIGYPF